MKVLEQVTAVLNKGGKKTKAVCAREHCVATLQIASDKMDATIIKAKQVSQKLQTVMDGR